MVDEPEIRYTRTSDGVDIAYWVIGEGSPLIEVRGHQTGHIAVEWRSPARRGWYEAVARHHRMVRYSPRGSGLSDRTARDFSTAAGIRDLHAVVSALDAGPVAVLSGDPLMSPWTVLGYAAEHSESLRRLIVFNGSARFDARQTAAMEVSANIEQAVGGRDKAAQSFLTWFELPEAERLNWVELYSASIDAGVTELLAAASREWEPPPLDRITTPTLLIHCRRFPFVSEAQARELALGITNARLLVLDSPAISPAWVEGDAALRPILDFLAEGAAPATSRPAAPRAVADVRLSTRELEVLRIVAEGKTNAEIAEALVISPNTVARHVKNILAKTGAANRTEAAMYASRHGLLE